MHQPHFRRPPRDETTPAAAGDETIDLRVGPRPVQVSLPAFDVRRYAEEAIGPSWSEAVARQGRLLVLVSLDVVLALLAAAISAALVRTGVGGPSWLDEVTRLAPAILFFLPLGLALGGSYGAGYNRFSFANVLRGVAIALFFAWGYALMVLPRAEAVLLGRSFARFAMIAVPAIWAGRYLYDALIQVGYRRGIGQKRVVLVGADPGSEDGDGGLKQDAPHLRVVARLVPPSPTQADDGPYMLQLESAIRQSNASMVLVDSSLTFEQLEMVVHRCFALGRAVAVMPRTLHKVAPRLELRYTGAGVLLQLFPERLPMPQLAAKRLADVVISAAVLALLSPLLLLIAIAIRIDSRGPILFRQVRAGLGGKPFHMYKFRTMVSDADERKAELHHLNESGDPRLWKIRSDPRITGVGRVLRRFSLDELPQLFNVLLGNMSLVGPRPFFTDDIALYDEHHFDRLTVLPGITGLWQVRGRSSVVDFEEVVRLDQEYIRRWSFWLDVRIILETLPAVFRRTGAY